MAFPDITQDLRAALPGLRGTLEANAAMAPLSWFRTGGPAQALFTPADEADLAEFMQGRPRDLPWIVAATVIASRSRSTRRR